MEINGTNLSMTRGDSKTITVSCKDQNGNKIILDTGDTVYFTVKRNPMVSEILIQKIITIFNEGDAIIEIEPEDTENLSFGGYQYDIQWVSSAGRVTTIVKPSNFLIEPEITNVR